MRHLYFIRHGSTVMNEQGLWSSFTNTPMTDQGRQQVKETGQAMRSQNLKIDLIVSSPLDRAAESARIVANEIGCPADDILFDELLVERNLGALEGKPYIPNFPKKDVADYEQDDALVARAHKALGWIKNQPADNILIVAHGGIGRALRSIVKQEFPMSYPHKLENARVYQLL